MVKKITINDGLELTPENGYLLQDIPGLGFDTNYSVNTILSKHGAKLGNVTYTQKNVRIILIVNGGTPEGLIEKRNNLFKYLTVNNYSPDDKTTFKFLLLNNLEVQISGVVKKVESPINLDTIVESPISISIETEFPFLTSSKLYQILVPKAIGGGAAVPMAIPLNFANGAANSYTTVPNGGNIFSYPVIRLVGPLTNPVLLDVLNDKNISLNMTIAEDEYIEVDSFEETVLDHDSANQLDKFSGSFLTVPAREDNRFRLTSDTTEVGYVTITYPYTYVAI